MKMKGITKVKPEKGLDILEYDVPELGYDEVLIKIRKAGICGTDMHIYNYDRWAETRLKLPFIAGHEFVGDVVDVGTGVKNIKKGERVSAEGHIICGACRFCRTGQGHICQNTKIIGVDINGCFADYIKMPEGNLWPVSEKIPDKFAAIFDPLGNAMHTITSGDISSKSVLISGAGAIGLFAIPLAKYMGANSVIVVEPNEYKYNLAKKVGADHVLKPQDKNIKEAVYDLTDGLGPEVVLEMSGNANGIRFAFDVIRNGGTYVMLGISSADVTINWAKDVIFKCTTIVGVSGRRMYDTWYKCNDFLEKHHDLIDPIITDEIDYKDYQKGFDDMNTGNTGKIILNFMK